MTAKQLEQETGCKIMVRGKGSMRDKKKVSEKAINGCFISSPAKIFKFIRERYIRVHKYLFLYIFFA